MGGTLIIMLDDGGDVKKIPAINENVCSHLDDNMVYYQRREVPEGGQPCVRSST